MKKSRVLSLGLLTGLIMALAFLASCVQAGEEGAEGTGSIMFLVIFVGFIAFFYFFMIRPQRKQRKDHEQLVDELRTGDRVITVGGIYGQIEGLSDENVVLKVESGVTIRISRNSIVVIRSK